MTRFVKTEMLDELRTIFLFEADHLLMGAGPEMAERFVGFEPGDAGEYCHRSPADVDLSRFQITTAFNAGYDYAFRPSVMNTLGEGEVQDLHVFMLGTPRAGGIGSGGETHAFMTQSGLCQTVADTVLARWKLEWDGSGTAVHDFTTRELALLADMTEGAVRNALADKSDSGLRAIPGTKNPVMVEHAEAMRWLKGRRGFIPTPGRASEDRFLTEHLQSVQSAEALGHLIGRRLWDTFGSPDKAPAALAWTVADMDGWQIGTQTFREDQARQLAQALDMDVPLFVGKALEVTLRRDLSSAKGGRS
ncbi:hypothetical protein LGH83_08170 [Lichenihabitans sp. PAMC28606]|uniref:hypothetical protein n=1 Tax=Lichenihabitans sp. PAMC28606 TaxID=2880932 RepID=UPI001D0B0C04|nr:hypothetical protein [Lichenihabitans sp. PAMC28606]UDL96145.1 hypothetical protein LGH83_08170 [Lichenihabitans sp. PAMC28606]